MTSSCTIRCPDCQRKLTCGRATVGMVVRCTRCRLKMRVPVQAEKRSHRIPFGVRVTQRSALQFWEDLTEEAPRKPSPSDSPCFRWLQRVPGGSGLRNAILQILQGLDFPIHNKRRQKRPRSLLQPWVVASISLLIILLALGSLLIAVLWARAPDSPTAKFEAISRRAHEGRALGNLTLTRSSTNLCSGVATQERTKTT